MKKLCAFAVMCILCFSISLAMADDIANELMTEQPVYDWVMKTSVYISPALCKYPESQLILSTSYAVEMGAWLDYLVVQIDRKKEQIGIEKVPVIEMNPKPKKNPLDRVFISRNDIQKPPSYNVKVVLLVFKKDDIREKNPQKLTLEVPFHSYRGGYLPTGHNHNSAEAFVVKLPDRKEVIRVKLIRLIFVPNK